MVSGDGQGMGILDGMVIIESEGAVLGVNLVIQDVPLQLMGTLRCGCSAITLSRTCCIYSVSLCMQNIVLIYFWGSPEKVLYLKSIISISMVCWWELSASGVGRVGRHWGSEAWHPLKMALYHMLQYRANLDRFCYANAKFPECVHQAMMHITLLYL